MIECSMEAAMEQIVSTRSTGVIAATALRVGQMLENTGHVMKALTVYHTAISRIERIDSFRAEDYYENGPSPANPYYRYWYERTNDADALEVAERLDRLYHQLGLHGYAHQQRRVRWGYELSFRGVYSACM